MGAVSLDTTLSMEFEQDVAAVLATLRSEADGEIAAAFYQFEDLWERKLWHQLTDELMGFYSDSRSQPLRYRLFTQFVATFQDKINQLSLARLGILAAHQCVDESEALLFLDKLAKRVKDNDEEGDSEAAYVFVQLEIAKQKMRSQKLEEAKAVIDESFKKIDAFEARGISPEDVNAVNAAYYGVLSEYYKFKADFTAYYRNALLYLGCINVAAQLSLQEQQKQAYDLAVAALLGDKVFTFSELLMHPILSTLENTDYKWLVDLLSALNSGDMQAFDASVPHLSKNPLLEKSLPFLRQKICLTALIEAIFRRPTSDRTLSFDIIAKDTRLVAEEVEHLIMRAFSLGLIKGFIDQVSQTVAITWVQPRVMNMAQIMSMKERLVTWDADVNKLTSKMRSSDNTEIWTGS